MSAPLGVRGALAWGAVALMGAILAAWCFPRVFPFLADGWQITGDEAAALALAAFEELGEPVEEAYVVVVSGEDVVLEQRLLAAAERGAAPQSSLAASRLGRRMRVWHVLVYPPGAEPEDFACYGRVSMAGDLLWLERRPEDGAAGEVDSAAARLLADSWLRRTGHEPASFEEPTRRRLERPGHTDVVLRYRDRERILGPEVGYGFDVEFSGDRLVGSKAWRDRAGEDELIGRLEALESSLNARLLVFLPLFACLAVVFFRRYNEGIIEVRRGTRLFLLLLACGTILVVVAARGTAGMVDYDVSRRLTTWLVGVQLVILGAAPCALGAALAWTVGEVGCRELWGAKLAAFDEVSRGRFASATVGRGALRGLAAGLALAGLVLGLGALGERLGVETLSAYALGVVYPNAPWPGPAMLLFHLLLTALNGLVILLFLLPFAVGRLGVRVGGVVVALVAAVIFMPPVATLPLGSELLFALPATAALVLLFLLYDLLTALLASLTLHLGLASLPYLFADDPFLITQGVVAVVFLGLPLLLSSWGWARGAEAVYRWEEVPPHVRRITERERLRFELETARRIQSSILPQLPRRLDGVELAHIYLPASEVGGDFYEAGELPDGRLALAVGDVAGHGVPSGLVMAMARSALASQMAIDPSVEAVFATLNRILHDSVRQRLLTTLCYGVVDARRRELRFACAGHLFPYLVGAGKVRWLESVAYPLGVRQVLTVRPTRVGLAPGDTLVLVSDGIVEARPAGSDELYGYERLAASLERHAGEDPAQLCEAVLADLGRFIGPGEREDDQTVLVARFG